MYMCFVYIYIYTYTYIIIYVQNIRCQTPPSSLVSREVAGAQRTALREMGGATRNPALRNHCLV